MSLVETRVIGVPNFCLGSTQIAFFITIENFLQKFYESAKSLHMFDAISKGEYHPSIEDIIYLSDFGGCKTFKPRKCVFKSLKRVFGLNIF